MIECPQCGALSNRHQGWCATCAAELTEPRNPARAERLHREVAFAAADASLGEFLDSDLSSMVRIARFQSAAEAGYFADALRHLEQIPAEVAVDEEREATHGSWSVRFALMVPASSAEWAALALRRLIEETSDEVAGLDNFLSSEPEILPEQVTRTVSRRSTVAEVPGGDFEENPAPAAGVNWVPIVITLAVGSAAFVTARKVIEAPRAQPAGAPIGARQDTFWNELADDPAPWRQTLPNGRVVRELVITPQHDRAILREDTDGDGRFDRERVWSLDRARR